MRSYFKAHRKVILQVAATLFLVLVTLGELVLPDTHGYLAKVGWMLNTLCWIWSDA